VSGGWRGGGGEGWGASAAACIPGSRWSWCPVPLLLPSTCPALPHSHSLQPVILFPTPSHWYRGEGHGAVDFSASSLMAAVLHRALQAAVDTLRTQVLGRGGFQQVQLDAHFLRPQLQHAIGAGGACVRQGVLGLWAGEGEGEGEGGEGSYFSRGGRGRRWQRVVAIDQHLN
jgi:hypothetical protein